LKRSLSSFFVFIVLCMGLISCGGYTNPNTGNKSGLTFRAFISNPVNPSATGGGFPGLDIMDANKDMLSPFEVSLSGTVASAGMMVESPKRDRTVVYSATGTDSSNTTLGIVDNATESATSSVALPGPTESMFVASDSNTLYAAVPSAPITGQSPGAVVQVSLPSSAVTATIPVPGARFVVPSPSGNQILVISDTADITGTVTVLAPALISTGNALTTVITNSPTTFFDKPVWAVFSSDGSTAYVMNCGPECGGTGTTASIAIVDMTQTTPAVTSDVPVTGGATTGLLSGGNLYVAGTPPNAAADCQANLCGVLTVFPSANLSATPSTFAITDGYHNNLVMAPNNQLFIASRNCTNVIASGQTLGRGCLSVLNTGGGTVYTAAQNGDVTGIQPILNRTVVYVCEGGAFNIYDTALDLGSQRQLVPQTTTEITIVGQAIDVKLVDF
jgi:hypothetical protein